MLLVRVGHPGTRRERRDEKGKGGYLAHVHSSITGAMERPDEESMAKRP